MAKVSHVLVSAFLILAFSAGGLVKLTDRLNPDAHKHMKEMFKEYAKVSPMKLIFKYRVEPYLYMRVVGVLECLCACMLCLGPRQLKMFACLVLLVIMIGTIQTLYFLRVPQQMFTPPALLLFLLLCNLYFLQKQSVELHAKAE